MIKKAFIILCMLWFAGCTSTHSKDVQKGMSGTGGIDAQLEPDTKCSELVREREGLLNSVKDIERRIGMDHSKLQRSGMLYHAEYNKKVLRIRMIEEQMKDLDCPHKRK